MSEAAEIKAPWFYRHVGRYDLARDVEEALLCVRFEIDGKHHAISDTVEPGGDHDYLGDDPFEAVEWIEAALKRYWVDTSREEKKQTVALFRQHEQSLRLAYLRQRAIRLQQKAADAAYDARIACDAYAEAATTTGAQQ